MKKFFSIAIMCMSLSIIAIVSTAASANCSLSSVSCSNDDLGPTVAKGITAERYLSVKIKIDVYRTANVCDSYVAYIAGTTTNPMAVLNNPDYRTSRELHIRDCRYFVSYEGEKYYFNL